MAQRKAKTEVEALLRSEGGQPALLASKLDALDPDTRAALCRSKDNMIAVGARLAEETAKKGGLCVALVRQLARAVPGGEDTDTKTKKLLVDHALVSALSAAMYETLQYALIKEDTTDEEFEAAVEALDSLVAATEALVDTKDPEIRDIVAENFLRHLSMVVTEAALPAMLRRDASQTLLDLVTCTKTGPGAVRSLLEQPDPRFAKAYFASLQCCGDMITQVNTAETLYRINKEAFVNLGPDQVAPTVNQVLGADALGPVKRDFYALLCMRHPPKKEALYDVLRNMVTRLNTALPGAERKVYTFLPDAVVLLPTRVERPAKGGGWELLEDAYSKRVDFNQSGFTLHLLTEPEEPGAATHGGSQQPLGSQGPPAAVVEPSRPVDVEYTNIRCIKRDTSTHGYVIWTVGLHEPVDDEEDDDDDQALTKDALAARAEAQKAMTKSDAAITLKFVRGDDASLEKDVMPLIFEANPEVVAAKPKPPAVKMSHATLVQGKSAAMDSQHGGGGGASMLDDATVIGALRAAPSENFGGQPERQLRVVQPPNASQLRDMFGGDKGAADSQALAPLGTQAGGAGGTQFIGTQVPKQAGAETTAGLTKFMDTLLPAEDYAAEAAEAAREAAAHAARRAKKAPAPADGSDSDETKDEPAAAAPRRPSAAVPPPAAAWGAPVSLGAAAAAAPPPPVSAKKGGGAAKAAPAAAAPAKAAAGGKKKSVTIKKPTQDPTPPVPKPPPPESELTDPPPTGAAAEEPADPFLFVPDSVAAKAPAAKAGKGGNKRAAQTPKKVPKKAPLGLTASLGSGGKHAAPSTRAAAAPPKPAAKPAAAPPPEEDDWDAPPPAGFLGGAAMDVDDDIVDDAVAAPLDEEDEEDEDAPAPQQQRKGVAAAKAMPPPPPRAPAAAAAGGRKSVAAPKTAPQEELAAAAAASKRKAAEEEAAAAAAEREAQAQAAAAKKAADAEKAAAAKKAAAAAKKAAAAEKAAADKAAAEKAAAEKAAAAAAAKAAAAEAARQKKAAADKAAADKAKAKPKARKAASASEDSSGGLAEESEEEEEEEEAAPKPKPRGKAGAQHPPADVTPEDRVAELGVRRVTEALAEQAAAAAAEEEAEQEAAAAAKQARRVAKPPRSPPAPAAANPRRTSAELVQRLLAGVDDDAPVAQSSELTACEPVEPRALFRTTSARPQKRKAGSPSGAGAADDATGGGAGRAAKRTRPLPGDTDDATLSALQRIVADAKAAAAARAKEEIAALLAAAWQDLDAALSALAARHADEREAMAAEFAASRAATLRRLNASRDDYQAAVKRFKADVAPMLSGRGGATDTLAALDAAMEERHTETRQKHAAEYKSVTKKMSSKMKQLEEHVARLQTESNATAHVKSAIEQLLSRM